MPVNTLNLLVLSLHPTNWVVPSIAKGAIKIIETATKYHFVKYCAILKIKDRIKNTKKEIQKGKHLAHKGNFFPL